MVLKGKMAYIVIITLNINGLPIKMQSGWMDLKKIGSRFILPTRDSFHL